MNLVKFITNNPDLFNSSLTYDTVALNVQTALSTVATNKQWFVEVYKAKEDYVITHATQCKHCFTVFNVNNDYNIFVGGVDASSEPNPSVQFPNWIQFERSKDYASDLVGFVNDVYQTYCVVGVSATLNSV